MGKVHASVYVPDPVAAKAYDALYEEDRVLHDYFGRGTNDVLHPLRDLRVEARARERDQHMTAVSDAQ